MEQLNNKYQYFLIIVVLFISTVSVFWMSSSENYFVFDDISLLRDASFKSYDELYEFYPNDVYCDRPIRNILLKWMFQLFGEDYTLHHVFLILFHLINVVLVFFIGFHLFSLNNRQNKACFICACFAALFFGAWPKSHMAVQWDSANCDLMGTTFALLSITFFIQAHRKALFSNTILSIFLYFLSIRTKEMFYPIPLMFIIYEIYQMYTDHMKITFKSFSITTYLALSLMFVFFLGIVIAKLKDKTITTDLSNPYYQSFNPLKMGINLLKYSLLCFDLNNSGFNFEHVSSTGLLGTILILIGLCFSIYLVIKKRIIGVLFLYISIAFSICTVLPMVNQTHVLYLYFPSIFIGFTLGALLLIILSYKYVIFGFVCLLLLLPKTWNMDGIINAKNYWFAVGKMEKSARENIELIDKPIKNTNIYIIVPDKNAYNPFYYGPGALFNMVWKDMSLRTYIIETSELYSDKEYECPYLIINWSNDGTITEIERNEKNLSH